MIVHGGRQWTDYRVETVLTIHLAQYAGVGIRVQGLRRYYAALLVRPDCFAWCGSSDDFVAILAETAFEWSFESRYEIAAEVVGRAIAVSVGGAALVAHDDDPRALENGGTALIINEGACSSDEVACVRRPRGKSARAGQTVERNASGGGSRPRPSGDHSVRPRILAYMWYI